MFNPSRLDAVNRKVVAAARSIVTYEIGLPLGCRRMSRMSLERGRDETGLLTVFEEYLKEAVGCHSAQNACFGIAKFFSKRTLRLKRSTSDFAIESSMPAGPSSTALPSQAPHVPRKARKRSYFSIQY